MSISCYRLAKTLQTDLLAVKKSFVSFFFFLKNKTKVLHKINLNITLQGGYLLLVFSASTSALRCLVVFLLIHEAASWLARLISEDLPDPTSPKTTKGFLLKKYRADRSGGLKRKLIPLVIL